MKKKSEKRVSRKDAKAARCHFDRRERSFSDPSHSLGMTDFWSVTLRAWRPFDAVYPERCRRAQDMLGAINFLATRVPHRVWYGVNFGGDLITATGSRRVGIGTLAEH
jgi:hypothetical protein